MDSNTLNALEDQEDLWRGWLIEAELRELKELIRDEKDDARDIREILLERELNECEKKNAQIDLNAVINVIQRSEVETKSALEEDTIKSEKEMGRWVAFRERINTVMDKFDGAEQNRQNEELQIRQNETKRDQNETERRRRQMQNSIEARDAEVQLLSSIVAAQSEKMDKESKIRHERRTRRMQVDSVHSQNENEREEAEEYRERAEKLRDLASILREERQEVREDTIKREMDKRSTQRKHRMQHIEEILEEEQIRTLNLEKETTSRKRRLDKERKQRLLREEEREDEARMSELERQIRWQNAEKSMKQRADELSRLNMERVKTAKKKAQLEKQQQIRDSLHRQIRHEAAPIRPISGDDFSMELREGFIVPLRITGGSVTPDILSRSGPPSTQSITPSEIDRAHSWDAPEQQLAMEQRLLREIEQAQKEMEMERLSRQERVQREGEQLKRILNSRQQSDGTIMAVPADPNEIPILTSDNSLRPTRNTTAATTNTSVGASTSNSLSPSNTYALWDAAEWSSVPYYPFPETFQDVQKDRDRPQNVGGPKPHPTSETPPNSAPSNIYHIVGGHVPRRIHTSQYDRKPMGHKNPILTNAHRIKSPPHKDNFQTTNNFLPSNLPPPFTPTNLADLNAVLASRPTFVALKKTSPTKSKAFDNNSKSIRPISAMSSLGLPETIRSGIGPPLRPVSATSLTPLY